MHIRKKSTALRRKTSREVTLFGTCHKCVSSPSKRATQRTNHKGFEASSLRGHAGGRRPLARQISIELGVPPEQALRLLDRSYSDPVFDGLQRVGASAWKAQSHPPLFSNLARSVA